MMASSPTPHKAPAVVTNVRPFVYVGAAIVLLLFGGLGTWGAVAPLSGAVVSTGVVTVETNRKTVQHLEGGILSRLHVHEGDSVSRGDLLIRLDDTRVRAQLAVIDGRLDVLQAREARLIAERDEAERISFPASLDGRAANLRVAKVLRGQIEMFVARRSALEGEISVLTQQMQQLKEEIRGLKAQRRAKSQQIKTIRIELKDLKDLYAKGLVPRPRIMSLEREAQRLKGEHGQHIADIARSEKAIGETKLQIVQLRKRTLETVITELREVQAEIFDVIERRVITADELKRIEIRAPRSGRVVGLAVHTVGAVITAGQGLMDIVPHGDKLVIEAQVLPADIDKVAVGLSAVVRLSAFDLETTPELIGAVTTVSADRLTDPATNQPYYAVRIRIGQRELAKLGALRLRAGMPAEAFIQTGDRTALSYFMKPFQDALMRAFRD
jgi:membrane fusion protein, type I secretion system